MSVDYRTNKYLKTMQYACIRPSFSLSNSNENAMSTEVGGLHRRENDSIIDEKKQTLHDFIRY